jgi:cell fate (sporulation/competence/biofilm development) regulator YmcA (YheA/YmcA/DUF963 family)
VLEIEMKKRCPILADGSCASNKTEQEEANAGRYHHVDALEDRLDLRSIVDEFPQTACTGYYFFSVQK